MRRRILSFVTALTLSFTFSMSFTGTVFANDSTTDFDSTTVDDLSITSDIELESGTDYIYENDVLTIKSDKAVTITGNSTTDRIEVADGVNADITLADVNIDVSGIYGVSALKIADYSTGNVKVTIADGTTNTLKASSAGLRKSGEYSDELGTLTIEGNTGKLTATGGNGGAGIGSIYEGSTSKIIINGGVIIAESTNHSAGIGGGYKGGGSHITINGGTVTATGSNNGAGIGSGAVEIFRSFGQAESGNIIITGGSVNASSISGTPTSDGTTPVYPVTFDIGEEFENVSVSLNNDEEKMYFSHPSNNCLYFYLPEGEDIAEYNGQRYTATVMENSENNFRKVDDSIRDFTITPTNDGDTLEYITDYTYSIPTGVLTINSEKPVTITGTTSQDRIEVADGVNANITLAGVYIDMSGRYGVSALKIADNSTGDVTINLADGTENTLQGSNAGLRKNGEYTPELGTLTIEGNTGRLFAIGGDGGAGIGSIYEGNTSNIIINGGVIFAKSTNHSAGIGGGYKGTGSHITINGGSVSAEGNNGGAGIGNGANAAQSVNNDIIITGGSVKTKSISGIPTSDGTTPVYLAKFDIGNPTETYSTHSISLNGDEAKTYIRHYDDSKLYFYLPEGETKAIYNSARFKADVITDNTAEFILEEPISIVSVRPFISDKITLQFDVVVSDKINESPVMHFTYDKEDYTKKCEWSFKYDDYTRYRFTCTKILPQQMNLNINAELLIGDTVYDTVSDYSVVQYVNKMLEKTDDPLLKDFLISMIYYGEAAQKYAKYDAPLPTQLLDEKYKRGISDEEWKNAELSETNVTSINNNPDDAVKWQYATVCLDNTVAMKYYFEISKRDYDAYCNDFGYRFCVNLGSSSSYDQNFAESAHVDSETGDTFKCYFLITDISPSEYIRDASVCVKYYNDNKSGTITSSVMAYILESKATEMTADENFLSIIHALYDYGKAGSAYKSSQINK